MEATAAAATAAAYAKDNRATFIECGLGQHRHHFNAAKHTVRLVTHQPYGCSCDLLMVLLGCAVFLHAGITVTELLRYATRNNLTVPLGVLPNYADLTIGGLLATGAHGIGGSGQANMVRLPLLPAATVCNSTYSDVETSHCNNLFCSGARHMCY
jgi:hypothetical protein